MIENYPECFGTSPIKTIRKATHRGLYFRGLPYQSSLLRIYQANIGNLDGVQIVVNPDNLSHCYVPDLDGHGYLAVPCVFRDYSADLSVKTHKRVMRLVSPFTHTQTEDRLLQARRLIERRSEPAGLSSQHIHPAVDPARSVPDCHRTMVCSPEPANEGRYTAMMADIAARLLTLDKANGREDGE